MSKREIIVRLEDVSNAVESLAIMIGEIKTHNSFITSLAYKMAFERAFEIIGEALYHIRKERPDVLVTDMNKLLAYVT